MKGLLKSLGLILVLIGAVLLIYYFFAGKADNNALLGTSAVLLIVGLVSYIVLNKRFAD
ncbi:MAG: hypothetical protein LBM06_00875 [Prevotellaceae bacterium]|jgi:hypothetical protein|nr:hypothetical protein [Prevotellaceae bacterium]